MAKYILLAFDDDSEADKFVDYHDQGVILSIPAYELNTTYDPNSVYLKPTVRAVFKKPTQFCECTGEKSFTRGRKYGWYVHAKCGKPTTGWAHGDIWYTALGLNLLPVSEVAPENRGPDHKKHPKE